MRDTAATPIIPDNIKMDKVNTTIINESLASGCLKWLWEAICIIVAPSRPQVKKHSREAQTHDWKIKEINFSSSTYSQVLRFQFKTITARQHLFYEIHVYLSVIDKLHPLSFQQPIFESGHRKYIYDFCRKYKEACKL